MWRHQRDTSTELRKLDSARWTVIDDVVCDGHRVEHVLVGNGRVYSVETERAGSVTRADRERLVQRATRSACRLERLLESLGTPATVTPMVVVWGPGAAAVTEPIERLGAVQLCAGPAARRWRRRLDRRVVGAGAQLPVVRSLRACSSRRPLVDA